MNTAHCKASIDCIKPKKRGVGRSNYTGMCCRREDLMAAEVPEMRQQAVKERGKERRESQGWGTPDWRQSGQPDGLC